MDQEIINRDEDLEKIEKEARENQCQDTHSKVLLMLGLLVRELRDFRDDEEIRHQDLISEVQDIWNILDSKS